jgi:hypothetical protein
MILYLKNPKDSTRRHFELINNFGKVAGYKINKQKSIAFVLTNTKCAEKEIRKTIPLKLPGNKPIRRGKRSL